MTTLVFNSILQRINEYKIKITQKDTDIENEFYKYCSRKQ